jgi:hypothetical protein
MRWKTPSLFLVGRRSKGQATQFCCELEIVSNPFYVLSEFCRRLCLRPSSQSVTGGLQERYKSALESVNALDAPFGVMWRVVFATWAGAQRVLVDYKVEEVLKLRRLIGHSCGTCVHVRRGVYTFDCFSLWAAIYDPALHSVSSLATKNIYFHYAGYSENVQLITSWILVKQRRIGFTGEDFSCHLLGKERSRP